jgi:hypothetical protein
MTMTNLDTTVQPSEATLSTLLYTKRNASEILQSKDIHFSHIVAVTIPDRYQLGIRIDYTAFNQQQQLMVPCTEFLSLAWADRMQRSHGYQAVSATATSVLVSAKAAKPGGQTYHVWIEPNGQAQCSCPDYANQFAVFQSHPALWHLIQQQPRCKYLLAAATVLDRSDLLNMPVLPTHEEGAGIAGSSRADVPQSEAAGSIDDQAELVLEFPSGRAMLDEGHNPPVGSGQSMA